MPGDGTSWNDKCLQQWLEETLCHNKVDDFMLRNSLVGAIVTTREDKDGRGAFCLKCHFAVVSTTTAQRVAGTGVQGTHWIVVAFDGHLLDTHTFTAYAWDSMDSDWLLRSCHENNIKVQHTILGHQKEFQFAFSYRSVSYCFS